MKIIKKSEDGCYFICKDASGVEHIFCDVGGIPIAKVVRRWGRKNLLIHMGCDDNQPIDRGMCRELGELLISFAEHGRFAGRKTRKYEDEYEYHAEAWWPTEWKSEDDASG